MEMCFLIVEALLFGIVYKIMNLLKQSLIYKIDFIYLAYYDLISTRLINTYFINFEAIIDEKSVQVLL